MTFDPLAGGDGGATISSKQGTLKYWRAVMGSITRFMNGIAGRLLRVFLGLVLVAIGLRVGGAGGYAVAAVGLLPIALGAVGHCALEAVSGSARAAMRR